jgi:protein BCP1
MPKRKDTHGEDADSDSGSDHGLINIDFDFFDPDEIDFIALKRLLAQLFQADTELLAIHELAELIISQNHIGTTVKTDGKESDPYAVLTVLNFQVHAVRSASRPFSPPNHTLSRCFRNIQPSRCYPNTFWIGLQTTQL